MANSKVTISFYSVPAPDEYIYLSETKLALYLHEVFKAARLNYGQVAIPTLNSSSYHTHTMTINELADISYIAVGFTPDPDPYQIIPLWGIEMTDNLDGTHTYYVRSTTSPVIINYDTLQAISWHEGSFSPTGAVNSYDSFISDHYKTAFDLDYNATALFTVESVNGEVNSGIGTVTITANYAAAVFVLDAFTANVNVLIENETSVTGISFSPSILAFTHKQHEVLPNKNVSMGGNLWKVVGKPNFLITSPTLGVTITPITDGSGTYQTISGSGSATIVIALTSYYNTDNPFLAGDLSGSFAVLENEVAFGLINYTVAVSKLSDILKVPYLSTEKAFTLDTKYFELLSENTNTYFQFDALIKTYEFFTNTLKEYTINQKIVLFKGSSKITFGKIIHRLMHKFLAVNESLLQYKYATLKVTCTEKLIVDDSTVRSGTSFEIPFVAGLSRGITNLGFLYFNNKPNRVTKNSFAYLNILIPSGNYELRVFKNDTLINSIALPPSPSIVLCKKVFFDTYEKGDVINFVIDLVGETNVGAPKKTFILYPEGNQSNMLIWENEFLLQSALECTGIASIKSEFEFKSQKKLIDTMEQLEHLYTAKEVKLFINTGWLLQTDVDTIESLMRSKRVWLSQGSSKINLRPMSKAIVNEDLDRELIEFSIEFIINRNYDEETYTL